MKPPDEDGKQIKCARSAQTFNCNRFKFGRCVMKKFNLLAIIILATCLNHAAAKVTYTFLEFPYKEIPKNEAMFHEYEAACSAGCGGRSGVSKTLCIRQCISPSCYKDLYQSDLLEEGEVDVRLISFKGCFVQRHNRSRP